jgi:hypothetical protein
MQAKKFFLLQAKHATHNMFGRLFFLDNMSSPFLPTSILLQGARKWEETSLNQKMWRYERSHGSIISVADHRVVALSPWQNTILRIMPMSAQLLGRTHGLMVCISHHQYQTTTNL